MSKHWQYFLPGYVLALPGTLIGLLLIVIYGVESIRLRSGCIEIVIRREQLIGGPWVGAQTYGNVILYRDQAMLEAARLRVHERVHVWQAMILTWPLFMVLYGAHFLANLALVKGPWTNAYRAIWAERMAYGREDRGGPSVWGFEP